MDIGAIETKITQIIPTESKRKVFLTIFCEAIQYANSFGAHKWGVKVLSNKIRLIVGSLITTTICEDSLWMALDKDLLSKSSPQILNLLADDWDNVEYPEYSVINSKNWYYNDDTLEKWEKIKQLHLQSIQKTCNKYEQLNVKSQILNSNVFIDYLNSHCSTSIPYPQYNNDNSNKFKVTGNWIFFCNPKYWQIDDFLETDEIYSTWRIADWQKDYFEEGQLAVIRVGNDARSRNELNGKERLQAGVYGIVEIISKPSMIPDMDGEHWLTPEKYGAERLRVKIKYIKKLLDNPILLSDIKHIEEFQDETALIKGRQVSSWSLSNQALGKIKELADSNNDLLNITQDLPLSNFDDLYKYEQKFFDATPRIKEVVSKRIERGDISKAVKKVNNYECQICKALNLDPHSFKKPNGEYYIETHHIIPVSQLEQGSLGTINLITVCANHHRQLHNGNVSRLENNEEFVRYRIDKSEVIIEKLNFNKKS